MYRVGLVDYIIFPIESNYLGIISRMLNIFNRAR